MDERVKTLRKAEPRNSGRASFQAILEAAAGLFRQFPTQDITLRDILSIAGVSNQTLYNYFPNGRNDIAIALFDRFQRTMVEDFNHHARRIDDDKVYEDSKIIIHLSACLARSVFGFLKDTYDLQSAVFGYLKTHNLLCVATHVGELEEAMARELTMRFGNRIPPADLARVARLSVCIVREIADQAMTNRHFPIDELESNARKLVRALLRTGLKAQDAPSGGHEFYASSLAPIAIVGAPISPIKKQSILDRILKRKRRG